MQYRCRRQHNHATADYPVYGSVTNRMTKLFHCQELEDECSRIRRNRWKRTQRYPWEPWSLQEMQRYREDKHYLPLNPCSECFPQ